MSTLVEFAPLQVRSTVFTPPTLRPEALSVIGPGVGVGGGVAVGVGVGVAVGVGVGVGVPPGESGSRSSYQTARRLPSAATERLGCHWALVGSVLVLSMKGALKVTPLSVERM